jgi:hypothetical protein
LKAFDGCLCPAPKDSIDSDGSETFVIQKRLDLFDILTTITAFNQHRVPPARVVGTQLRSSVSLL